MPDERESPSAGWREVYDALDADAGVEDATLPCPDCGRTCENVLRDVYECDEHGVFRTSGTADDTGTATSDAEDGTPSGRPDGDENPDESGGPERRARESAD